MKKGIFLLLLITSLFAADAQSLKEALYGGKLKNQPGTVVRKGDDLAKLEAEKKEAELKVVDSLRTDSLAKVTARLSTDSATNLSDSVAVTAVATGDTTLQTSAIATPASEDREAPKEEAPAENAVDPKDNNALLKAYMNGLVTTLKSEVLSSKKVKDGSYYVLVSYAIETDGQLNITDVFVSPENDFMQKQIKERLSLDTPKLNPVLSSSGKARKVNKKYNFTLVKE
jgi:acetyl/propionyl-CoA carboxylase alpha subunit